MNGDRLKAAFLGSKIRIAATALGVVVVALGAAVALGVFGVPAVESVDNRFGDVNDTTTVVVTDLTVSNPNPVGTGFLDASATYTVRMNDVRMAAGERGSLALSPGRNELRLETYMDNRRIPDWWVTHIRNGERTDVAIDARIRSGTLGQGVTIQRGRTINTSMIERFNSTETREIEGDSPLSDGPVLYVNETSGRWGNVTEAETPVNTAFVAYNPENVPYTVTQIRYEITMNGITVGEGTSDREYIIEPRTTEEIRTRTAIRNENLDEWWVSHLRNDERTELRIEFAATIEVEDPTSITGDTVSLDVPLDAITHEETIETDILGSGNETSG
ncbi:LEA type 2 family protein [Halostella salina]|uniref:LEA type 2 family protein n=1 Tax=Halostella salina TaxID=1547897 RepID=UPI0013CED1A9|nr:LEA type 2 family protein [Halostella salina]